MKKKMICIFAGATVMAGCAKEKGEEVWTGENPPYEVAVEMSGGTVVWAGSNLSGYRTFAKNPSDHGCLFQWGWKDAVEGAAGGDGVVMSHSVAQSATSWPDDENPCPEGWRVPTNVEMNDLINKSTPTTDMGAGKADGQYTVVSWAVGTGAGTGLKITPKAGDTGKSLYFPNAGWCSDDVGSTVDGAGSEGCYWTATQHYNPFSSANGDYLNFNSDHLAGYLIDAGKLLALSVRCVK